MNKPDKEREIYLKDVPPAERVQNPWIWFLLLLVPFAMAMGITYLRGDKIPASYVEKPEKIAPPATPSGQIPRRG